MRRYALPGANVRVSVVMPFFNHGPFIIDALDALRHQSRPPDEIVIVDDGSTDEQSRKALEDLRAEGVVVVHEEQKGPGAARNIGVENSTGEVLFFLDSDDLVTERHIEVALETLKRAPDDVGFVYPDMQCFGNQEDLVVMPPYNLYWLLFRNFCCMGGLIDRAVFDSGNQFRTDLTYGHEDWDFFITLGVGGIFGAPFHGAPLLYRRWGFSRSDVVQEKATFMREVRDLHPELNESQRLINIKREWAPALSIVVPKSAAPLICAVQTCDDFELVYSSGVPPRVRGRLVMLLGGSHADVLQDETCVERIVRLLADRDIPTIMAIHRASLPGWVGSRGAQVDEHDPIAFMMDGTTFDSWRERAGIDIEDFNACCAQIAQLINAEDHWTFGFRAEPGSPREVILHETTAREERVPRQPPPRDGLDAAEVRVDPVDQWPAARLAKQGIDMEQSFRHWEARPLFIPSGGFRQLPTPPGIHRDGLEAITQRAWSDWMPPRAVRLDLVVDMHGQTLLDVFDSRRRDFTSPSGPWKVRIPIGWVWTQAFPGTIGLFSRFDLRTHKTSYRLSEHKSEASDEVALGYLPTEALPGRISLWRWLREISRSVEVDELIDFSLIAGEGDDVFVESITASAESNSSVEENTWTVPPRRWPLFEISLRTGGYRYTCEPDACVGRIDSRRPFPIPVADVAEFSSGPLAPLYEAQDVASGRVGYISQLELVAALEGMKSLGVVGGLQATSRDAVPLVRLRKQGDPPEGDLGHRLAISWQSVVSEGYTTEGVVGFAWRPDPTRVPLYRWRDTAKRAWHLSLGDDASREFPHLAFEGTLGSAWVPAVSAEGYVDLWEMERHGALSYAIDPTQLESHGYVARRIVARLLGEQRWGTIPLLSWSSEDHSDSLVTTSDREGRWAGMSRYSVLGYLDAALPSRSSSASRAADAVLEWAVEVRLPDGYGGYAPGLLFRDRVSDGIEAWGFPSDGRIIHIGSRPPDIDGVAILGYALQRLTPFSRPVYLITSGESGPYANTLSLGTPSQGSGIVRGVAGFLPGASSMHPEAKLETRTGFRSTVNVFASKPTVRRLQRVMPRSIRKRIRHLVSSEPYSPD
jgi:hypothetical protein